MAIKANPARKSVESALRRLGRKARWSDCVALGKKFGAHPQSVERWARQLKLMSTRDEPHVPREPASAAPEPASSPVPAAAGPTEPATTVAFVADPVKPSDIKQLEPASSLGNTPAPGASPSITTPVAPPPAPVDLAPIFAGVVTMFNAGIVGRLTPRAPGEPPEPPQPIDPQTAGRMLADAWQPCLPVLQDPKNATIINMVGAGIVTIGVFLPPILQARAYGQWVDAQQRRVSRVEQGPANEASMLLRVPDEEPDPYAGEKALGDALAEKLGGSR